MTQKELEKYLHKKIMNRRIIETIIFFCFFAIGLTFSILYNNSRTVEYIDCLIGIYESVTYNNSFVLGMFIGWFGLFITSVIIICDLLLSNYKVTEVENSVITLYKGMLAIIAYVDGECQDTLIMGRRYLEAKLKNGTKVTISRGALNSYHLTFSSNHEPIDL